MNREQLEYSISRYLDGTLPGTERLSLDIRLNQDAEARALLEEYRAFDASLNAAKQALPALPELDWDALAAKISASITQAEESGELEQPAAAVAGRIGFGSLRAWMAVAASVVIAAGIGFSLLRQQHAPTPTHIEQIDSGAVAAAVEIKAVDPINADDSAAAAKSSPVVVAIGPSSDSDSDSNLSRYSDSVVSRSSNVLIASGNRPVQDTLGFPY